jgi:enoyl-CoA hydratase/carnithine racemase
MLLRRTFSTNAHSILSSTLGCSRKIVLNREKALNSLNMEMCSEIKHLLTEWNADPNVCAVLMRGAGSKAFCAGMRYKRGLSCGLTVTLSLTVAMCRDVV